MDGPVTWRRIGKHSALHAFRPCETTALCGRRQHQLCADAGVSALTFCAACRRSERRLKAQGSYAEVRFMCDQVGGQVEMSRRLGINQRTVRRWCSETDGYAPSNEWMERMRDVVAEYGAWK